MIWIILLVFTFGGALIQLGAAIVKVSFLTIALKFLGALLVFVLVVATAHAVWQRLKNESS